MSLLNQPCQTGSNDYERCGNGLVCNKLGHKYYDSLLNFNICHNPCNENRSLATRPPGVGNGNTYYQNNPNKPDYDKCIKGVGSGTQNNSGTTAGTGQGKSNIKNSQKISQRQEDGTNRFCLCPVDIGCKPEVVKPKKGLEFNFMWIVGNVARNDDTRDWYEFGRDAKCKTGPKLIDRPRITASTPWAKRDDNGEICVEGNCCKDGPGPGRGNFDCGTKRKDGWTAASPTDTSRESQQGFYWGSGEAAYSCDEYFASYGPGIKNGAVQTQGPNTEGCEHFEFYCESALPCWRDSMFSAPIKDAFDISSREFGGYWAAKVSVQIPPQGETHEVFLHYHIGIRGAGGSKARMWVNELTKGQQDFGIVSSAVSSKANPRQSGSYKWDDNWDLCSNTTGGPNPTNPNFKGDVQATIGVLTVMPDGTWTVGLP